MRILFIVAILLAIALPALAANEKPEMTSVEGKHIIFKARADDMKLLKDPQTWVANLDRVYEAYADLVGDTPYGGKKITILSTEEDPGGWAVAGNPILWNRDCFLDSIERMNKGDWSFGIMHEIGHDFDLDYRWVWNAELWANFKLDYAAEAAKAIIFVYGRDEICDYSNPKSLRMTDIYRQNVVESGNLDRILVGDMNEENSHLKLAELVKEIGWEPFKKVFRWFNSLSPNEITDECLSRRSLFIRALEEQSGVKIVDRFINWGFSYTAVDAKDALATARILHNRDWYADVVERPIQAAPGEEVTVRIALSEPKEKTFDKGLGTHAESEIVYALDGKYERFESYIGVTGRDNAHNHYGSVSFEVVLDGKSAYKSPVLKGGGAYKHIQIDVSGVKELRLLVGDGGDGDASDHAGWADAKVIDAKGVVSYLSDMTPVKVHHSYGELNIDRGIDGGAILFGHKGLTRTAKIVGIVDGRSVTFNPDNESGSYSYTFKGFDTGTHQVRLKINVGDSPITQHELVTVIVK